MPYPSASSPLLVPRAMSLLDQLWDDTVAGPRPDNGLGRLRKFRTFDLPSDSGKESYCGNLKSFSKAEDAVRVTRSIMIVKPPGFDNQHGSPPGFDNQHDSEAAREVNIRCIREIQRGSKNEPFSSYSQRVSYDHPIPRLSSDGHRY